MKRATPECAADDGTTAAAMSGECNSEHPAATAATSNGVTTSVGGRNGGRELQGYDFDFLPLLDKKYECPICLLCMRDPVQTSCGHRFCKECIMLWLRNEGERCPEDNLIISPDEVFADNFAKREILNLKVRCPNSRHGCGEVTELLHVKKHVVHCGYGLHTCPNLCGEEVMYNRLEHHVKVECCRRLVTCVNCKRQVPFDEQQSHLRECPEAGVSCHYCSSFMTRQKLLIHVQCECPNAILNCYYHRLGCTHQCIRDEVPSHEDSGTQDHMRLLCAHLVELRDDVTSLSQRSSVAAAHAPLAGDSGAAAVASGGKWREDKPPHKPTGHSPGKGGDGSLEEVSCGGGGGDAVQCQHPHTTSSERLTNMDTRLVVCEQKNRELEFKVAALENSLLLSDKLVRALSGRVQELAACPAPRAGEYVWRVREFPRLLRDVPAAQVKVLHSPAFYTSTFGYKLCVRLNVNGAETTYGKYLSLFIHFMRGESDDVLDWPFHGTITLSILEQQRGGDAGVDGGIIPVTPATAAAAAQPGKHITEQFNSQPHLAAFQRPTQDRNAKGFGYMEFAPLQYLSEGRFIRRDTLVVKAVVRVGDGK